MPIATMRAAGVPLPAAEVDVLQGAVAWDEFKVGVDCWVGKWGG